MAVCGWVQDESEDEAQGWEQCGNIWSWTITCRRIRELTEAYTFSLKVPTIMLGFSSLNFEHNSCSLTKGDNYFLLIFGCLISSLKQQEA